MEKRNPLLPFAFSVAAAGDTSLPLNSAPRHRKIRDEDASSMYHTRTSPASTKGPPKGPFLGQMPSLKRKMGASFNENDDTKRRDTLFDDDTAVDSDQWGPSINLFLGVPSSPPPGALASEMDISTAGFAVPGSPREATRVLPLLSPQRGQYSSQQGHFSPQKDAFSSQTAYVAQKGQLSGPLSSDADFGIDAFNRFSHSSTNQCPSTDRDNFDVDEYQTRQKQAQTHARSMVLDAFENVRTTVNLEGMGLVDVPEEVGDFDNLVVFDLDPSTQPSYQLYLTNNRLAHLPPSLFNFTKLNVLGLRHNKLRTIPQLVGNLVHLTDLSLGTNRLEYLPPQILDLPLLQSFRAGPNPFMKVPDDALAVTTSTLNPVKTKKYVSKVVFHTHFPKHVRSLRAHCLNTIARYDVSYQETKNWKRSTPKMYHALIARAISRGRYNELCSECETVLVDPVAEAYEWWDLLQNKDVPIKREFCSGSCAARWERKTNWDLAGLEEEIIGKE